MTLTKQPDKHNVNIVEWVKRIAEYRNETKGIWMTKVLTQSDLNIEQKFQGNQII